MVSNLDRRLATLPAVEECVGHQPTPLDVATDRSGFSDAWSHCARVARSPHLSLEEIDLLGDAITVAAKNWRVVIAAIVDEYSLGPRGIRILRLIDGGQALAPSELVPILRCVPSLITSELSKLSAAGLIVMSKSGVDGRRIVLSLTPLGKDASKRAGEALTQTIGGGLAGYSRQDILLCAGMLREFANLDFRNI